MRSTAVCKHSSLLQELTRAIWDHTVLLATRHPTLPSQLRLVLDLATPEECKAELT